MLREDKAYHIASMRLRDLPSGIKTLVTACPSCIVTLRTQAAREGLDIEVIDIVDLLVKAIVTRK